MKCKYSQKEIEQAVKDSRSYADIFRNLNLIPNGGSYPWIKRVLKTFEIDTSHFYFSGEKGNSTRRIKGKNLRAILRESSVEEKCNCCGLSEWMGNKLRLDVDHINGDLTDNSPQNLQFLCPNCHRNKTNPYKEDSLDDKTKQCSCGKLITNISSQCRDCHWKDRVFNYEPKMNKKLPDPLVLSQLVWELPLTKLSEKFGVSDVGIKKNLKKFGIPSPGRSGYWKAVNSNDFEKATGIRKKIENP